MRGTSSQWEAPAATADEGGDSWGFKHSTSAYQLGDIGTTDVPRPAAIGAFGASGILRGGSKRRPGGAPAWKPSGGAILEVKLTYSLLGLEAGAVANHYTTSCVISTTVYNTRVVACVAVRQALFEYCITA